MVNRCLPILDPYRVLEDSCSAEDWLVPERHLTSAYPALKLTLRRRCRISVRDSCFGPSLSAWRRPVQICCPAGAMANRCLPILDPYRVLEDS
jgi:hypothetical protein